MTTVQGQKGDKVQKKKSLEQPAETKQQIQSQIDQIYERLTGGKTTAGEWDLDAIDI